MKTSSASRWRGVSRRAASRIPSIKCCSSSASRNAPRGVPDGDRRANAQRTSPNAIGVLHALSHDGGIKRCWIARHHRIHDRFTKRPKTSFGLLVRWRVRPAAKPAGYGDKARLRGLEWEIILF
jgi:hypothetical protein